MAQAFQKLELTWIGKGEEPALEPRLLLLEPEHCCGDSDTENMLIHGDNLLALKALEQEYAGKIKCIYIDPPYNTGNAFEHYDDGIEHSLWLNLMYHRLVLLRNLLHTEGSIWISVDDNEAHYLKVMMDEIFGRQNFIATVIWHKKHTRSNDAKWLSDNHDFIVCFAKNKSLWQRNLLPREGLESGYSNPDNDPRGVWASGPCHAKTPSDKTYFEIETPSGRKILPPSGTSWRFSKERFKELIKDNRIYFGESGNNVPRYKRFLTEVQDGLVPTTLWFKDEVGDNQEAKKEVKAFNNDDVFSTPKPERLIERVLTLATNAGDLVLDSFLGSGTTAAVAHKMGRRWIGIELGQHAYTHCLPRLRKVVDGSDTGGISKAVGWQGGGGFKVCRLAPSLLERDTNGILTFNPQFTDEMVAKAVAKIEGYSYLDEADSLRPFWQQAVGTDKSYLYVTKAFITAEWLSQLAAQVPLEVSLLVCCPAFTAQCEKAHKHIKLKKIPQAFKNAYDFGQNDYSLNVANVLASEAEDDSASDLGAATEGGIAPSSNPKKRKSDSQTSLF